MDSDNKELNVGTELATVEGEAVEVRAVDDIEERMKVKVEVEIDTSDMPDESEEEVHTDGR